MFACVHIEDPQTRGKSCLAAGQLWRTTQGYIEIVQLGKTLAHYRRSRAVGQKGVPVLTTQIKTMASILEEGEARMVKKAS